MWARQITGHCCPFSTLCCNSLVMIYKVFISGLIIIAMHLLIIYIGGLIIKWYRICKLKSLTIELFSMCRFVEVYKNVLFTCQQKTVKCHFLWFLAFFQPTLTFEQRAMLTDDYTDESGALCSQSWQPCSQLQLTLSTGSDQTSQKCDCFSSRAWPEEIKPEVGLMPAGTINLLFISNPLDHHGLF